MYILATIIIILSLAKYIVIYISVYITVNLN